MEGGKQHPGHTTEGGPHAKRQQLQVAGVDAHRLGGNFVFTDRHPRPSDARGLQSITDQRTDQNQCQKQVVILGDAGQLDKAQVEFFGQGMAKYRQRVNLTQALGPIGDVHRVVQVVHEDADDLTKAQRDDGQVVAAQLQGRRAQQHPEQTRQARTNGHYGPQGQMQAAGEHGRNRGEGVRQVRRGQQTKHVSTHRKESHESQIQQARIPHHNVQAQCQQHIQQGHVGNAHPRVAQRLQHQR